MRLIIAHLISVCLFLSAGPCARRGCQVQAWKSPTFASRIGPRFSKMIAPTHTRLAISNLCKGERKSRRRCASVGVGGHANAAAATGWLTLPTVLTLARVFAIPVFAQLFVMEKFVASTAVFVLSALTDWLDGYLARRLNQTTPFGAFLDPVADKLMVLTAMVLLVLQFPLPWMAIGTAICVCREVSVCALREFMASVQASNKVAVGFQGKVKTATQMVSLSLLLFACAVIKDMQGPAPSAIFKHLHAHLPPLLLTGVATFVLSCILTITSAIPYLNSALPFLISSPRTPTAHNSSDVEQQVPTSPYIN